jgi:hypothetical protein
MINHMHLPYSVFHTVKKYEHKIRTHCIHTFTDKLHRQNNYLRVMHICMYLHIGLHEILADMYFIKD